MRNRYLEKFDSMVKISVKGNNVYNYLKRVMKDKIKIVRVIPISKKEIHLILKIDEYQKLIEYRSVYKIDILEYCGSVYYISKLKKYLLLFLFLIMGILVIFFLSRIISLGIEMFGLFIFIDIFDISKLFTKVIMCIIVVIVNYIFSKLFVFKKSDN